MSSGVLKGAAKMTRETKVGLVVCCSFLCLVGVVLGCKLRGSGNDESADADEQVVVDDPVPAPPTPVEFPRAEVPGAGIEPAGHFQLQQPPAQPQAEAAAQGIGNEGGQPRLSIAGVGAAGNQPPARQAESPQPAPPMQPAQAAPVEQVMEVRPIVGPPYPPPPEWVAAAEQAAAEQVAAAPAGSTPPPGGPSSPPPPAPPAPSPGGGLVHLPPPPPAAAGSSPPPPAAGSSAPPTVAEPPPPPPAPQQAPSDAQAAALPQGAAVITPPAGQQPPEPGKIIPPPPPDPAPGAVETPKANLLPPRPLEAGRAEALAPGVMPSRPVSPVPAADTAPEDSGRPAPTPPRPVGAVPTVSSPPIVIPAPASPAPTPPPVAGRPKVESFDEETYRCKLGDSFARISQSHYHTDKYSQALMLFNVNHPLASEAVRQNPQQLQEGAAVYIPPTSVLEARYGALFPELAPRPAAPAPAGAEAARVDRAANASPRPGGAWATPQGYKWYRVSPRGETMWDMARTTLGDGNRWKDILALNPGLRSEYPVPGGTLLKLPADARVEAAAAPPR